MWSWRRRETNTTTSTAVPDGAGSCGACERELAHCHGVLVLHADGTLECGEVACASEPGVHEWWVPCVELTPACGCVGDEHPGAHLVAA